MTLEEKVSAHLKEQNDDREPSVISLNPVTLEIEVIFKTGETLLLEAHL